MCGNQKISRGCMLGKRLLGGSRLLLFRLVGLAALTQFGLFAFFASGGAFCRSDDINDDFSVVLAALGACAVREPGGSALAFRETLGRYCVVVAPLCGLRTVPAHPDYHDGGLYRL